LFDTGFVVGILRGFVVEMLGGIVEVVVDDFDFVRYSF
jgi:hypothetical protein